jgi:flagellar biosynthesis/type III secretory pathway protein FliH
MRRVQADSIHSQPLWQATSAAATARASTSAEGEAANVDAHRNRLQAEFLQARKLGHEAGLADAEKALAERVEQGVAALKQQLQAEAETLRTQVQARELELSHWLTALPEALRTAERQAEEAAVVATYSAVAHFFGERHAQGGMLRELCLEALRHVQGEATAIHLNPDECAAFDAPGELPVLADARLQPGQCRIETRLGHYDAGLDVRMDLIREALLSGLAQHRAEQDAA